MCFPIQGVFEPKSCECCHDNGYQCDCCGHAGEPIPDGYIHPGGYIWDAKEYRQWSGLELLETVRVLKEKMPSQIPDRFICEHHQAFPNHNNNNCPTCKCLKVLGLRAEERKKMNRKWRPVIIESPFKGNDDHSELEHREYLDRCIADCISRGETPYASHKQLADALDDNDPVERSQGIDAGLGMADALVSVGAYAIFYEDYGMSWGMDIGKERHTLNGTEIRQRLIGKNPDEHREEVDPNDPRFNHLHDTTRVIDYSGCKEATVKLIRGCEEIATFKMRHGDRFTVE